MKTTSSKEFQRYGYTIAGSYPEILSYLETKTKMPEQGNLYVAKEAAFETLDEIQKLSGKVFGGLETEAGYCNGYNNKLNCLEYHASPEVNIATEDIILLLARLEDVGPEDTIDSSQAEPFLIHRGECIVLYPFTFHFSPILTTAKGFRCLVLLPDKTNTDLMVERRDVRLFKTNKWLYAHNESKQAKNGAYIGITGENISFDVD